MSLLANFSISTPASLKLNHSHNFLICYSFTQKNDKTSRNGRKRTWLVRNSAEAAASEAPAAEAEEETLPVGSPKGFTSLLSAANVEKALKGIAITSVDHYERLGIPRGTSYDQVTDAYKKKCEELQNKELEELELRKEMEFLKESYAILSSEEERRIYDWSLARTEKPDRYVWPFEVDITQTPTQPAPPKEPEDELPSVIIGYALLGWIILSFVLSVILSQN